MVQPVLLVEMRNDSPRRISLYQQYEISQRLSIANKGEESLIKYLNHTNTRANINKKIWEQFIVINLHKLLLALLVGESFMTDCLPNHYLEMHPEISEGKYMCVCI